MKAPRPLSRPAKMQIRLMQTTDLHGTLRSYDYLADKALNGGGLSRLATLIRRERAAAPNTLLFDCGDAIQGSATCDLVARLEIGQAAPHPVIEAMNSLNYDAATPGNHDFDYGADFLFEAISGARFPFLCCNLHRKGSGLNSGPPALEPHRIVERRFSDADGRAQLLRIGITGCLPPQTIEWDHHLSADFHIRDMTSAVREEVATMRAAGCDLVVVLAHSGLEDSARPGGENAVLPLAELEGVDAIMAGHTHARFPGPVGFSHPAIDTARGLIHGTPVVMGGFWGSHLGIVELDLEQGPAGWRVGQARTRLCPAGGPAEIPEDPKFLAVTEPTHRATLTHIRRPVGETRVPLHSYFSLFANDAALQLVARAQASFLRDTLAGTGLEHLPLLSAAAPFKTGQHAGPDHYTHVPAGPLTWRSLSDLYVYPNTFSALRITGGALRNWLEHSASVFARLDPADPAPQPLLREDLPGYKFDVICGLTYEIDLSQPPRFDGHSALADPAATRIRNLRWNGAGLRDDMEFIVATNAFRAHGIGFSVEQGFDPPPAIAFETRTWNRDILMRYLRAQSPLDIEVLPHWSFTGLGGVRASVLTSPLARTYLDDPHLPPLEDRGDTPEGFMDLHLTI